ncbi:hypothetical protein [Stenotrophomonas sp. S39]|uniref:hypothetical protein n=1 Tax=Stenotrophomonas sp. S39 TaxID=2767451 RepID=UPI00190ADA64|nr:hypothetical protein [Stenotrophomonas sp. S39]MBK0054346.1 hypothetical protein [Stenotrophomonas sp. S39]
MEADPAKLILELGPGETVEQRMADQLTDGIASNAFLTMQFGHHSGLAPPGDMTPLVNATQRAVEATKRGGTEQADALLTSQAIALNTVFLEMGRRAALAMGDRPSQMERYMRLALKAQAQCRSTLESLAEIRNPRPVAFVKQANIASGHQQINNGCQHGTPQPIEQAPREQCSTGQIKVLEEASRDEWLDTRASAPTGRGNPIVATVGEVDRPKDDSGEGKGG